jgi:hypothetical protein
MLRWIAWLAVFGLGLAVGRLSFSSPPPAAPDDGYILHELADRQRMLVEVARERYERFPGDFQTASRLALLLSGLSEVQQRQAREFGARVIDPVYVPEVLSLLQHCRRLARTNAELDLVRGMEVRVRRQETPPDSAG